MCILDSSFTCELSESSIFTSPSILLNPHNSERYFYYFVKSWGSLIFLVTKHCPTVLRKHMKPIWRNLKQKWWYFIFWIVIELALIFLLEICGKNFIYHWHMVRSKSTIIYGCYSSLDWECWGKNTYWDWEEASALIWSCWVSQIAWAPYWRTFCTLFLVHY